MCFRKPNTCIKNPNFEFHVVMLKFQLSINGLSSLFDCVGIILYQDKETEKINHLRGVKNTIL